MRCQRLGGFALVVAMHLCAGPAAAGARVDVSDHADGVSAEITARILISAPPDTVKTSMMSCDRARAYIEGLRECAITARDPAGRFDTRLHRIERGWPLPAITSIFRQTYVGSDTIRVTRIGGDLQALDGTWHLTKQRNGAATLLTYSGRVAFQTLIPRSILKPFVEADFRKTLERMAADIERQAHR